MKLFTSFGDLRSAIILILFCACVITSCSDDDKTTVPVVTEPVEVADISPSVGPKTTLVTITGANFSTSLTENTITFNGKPATIITATATQLTVTVPPAADSGPVIVTTKGKSATNQPMFTFQWLVSTLAGSTEGYVDGVAAKFNSPSSVAADKEGNLYITDYKNHVIRKITPAGLVITLTGSVPGYDDGPIATAKFYLPNGSTVDGQGNVYISEEGTHRIRRITPAGQVSTLAGSTSGAFGSADGIGTSATFNTPSGIDVDDQGNLYVADQFNNRIRKITPSGVVTNLAGSTQGFADGTGAAAQFFRPCGVAVDSAGNVYVADLFNHRIRKITASGVVTTLAGSSYGFSEGTGTAAKFAYPAGLALDRQGNLYVADSENERIRKVTPAGAVSTLAGIGTQGKEDGLAPSAMFFAPREIDIDAEGNMYVVETGNHRVRKID